MTMVVKVRFHIKIRWAMYGAWNMERIKLTERASAQPIRSGTPA
jgi:hypothetical protein